MTKLFHLLFKTVFHLRVFTVSFINLFTRTTCHLIVWVLLDTDLIVNGYTRNVFYVLVSLPLLHYSNALYSSCGVYPPYSVISDAMENNDTSDGVLSDAPFLDASGAINNSRQKTETQTSSPHFSNTEESNDNLTPWGDIPDI